MVTTTDPCAAQRCRNGIDRPADQLRSNHADRARLGDPSARGVLLFGLSAPKIEQRGGGAAGPSSLTKGPRSSAVPEHADQVSAAFRLHDLGGEAGCWVLDEEAGRNGTASHLDGSCSLLRARPVRRVSDITRSYPEQQKLHPTPRLTATPG